MAKTKRALLVTTVSGFVPQFEMGNVHILQNMGFEVHYAANYNTPSYGNDNHRLEGTGIIRHQIDFIRSPFKLHNIKVYRQLKKLMAEEHFDLVHCHTPMGGVMARLAAHASKTYPVVYTAHGFHFFVGAPVVNWLFYYPIEKYLSRYTDEQICINKEDYDLAKRHFRAKYVDCIPGAGISSAKMQINVDVAGKKKELGIPVDKTILLSSGELIKRKNHETIIRAVAQLKQRIDASSEQWSSGIHYVLCGHGELDEYLRKLAEELQVSDIISFLGYREDMMEIFEIADVFLFPSFQEGLPMALLEAMAHGLPVICSDIRGNRDLIGTCPEKPFSYCDGGIMIKQADDISSYSQALEFLLRDEIRMREMGNINRIRAEEFSDQHVEDAMKKIYQKVLFSSRKTNKQ